VYVPQSLVLSRGLGSDTCSSQEYQESSQVIDSQELSDLIHYVLTVYRAQWGVILPC